MNLIILYLLSAIIPIVMVYRMVFNHFQGSWPLIAPNYVAADRVFGCTCALLTILCWPAFLLLYYLLSGGADHGVWVRR